MPILTPRVRLPTAPRLQEGLLIHGYGVTRRSNRPIKVDRLAIVSQRRCPQTVTERKRGPGYPLVSGPKLVTRILGCNRHFLSNNPLPRQIDLPPGSEPAETSAHLRAPACV